MPKHQQLPWFGKDPISGTIPPRGPLAALTVPGAVAGWALALEAASAYGGRMHLTDLLAPAIAHAKDGAIVTRSQAQVTSEKLPELKDVPGFADVFLIEGKPPAVGARLRQIALAATLTIQVFTSLTSETKLLRASRRRVELVCDGMDASTDEVLRW